MRVASLALALFAFWLLLSGLYKPFLIGAGAISAIVIALAGRRFGYTDREGHPVELILAGFRYWPWLLVEIAKSAFNVARIILSPSLPIGPQLAKLRAGPQTAVGMATLANSITLTPGTITVDTDRHHHWIGVHALTGSIIADLKGGDMDRRVARFEKQS